MKNLFLVVVGMFMIQSTMNAQVQFGAGAQLMFDNSVFGIQGKALYNINESLDGAASFTLHLEDGLDWSIDLDAQYLLLEVANEIGFKPFAGLNILKGTGDTDIGLNIGAFFDVLRSGDYQIYVEPKFRLGDYDSLVVSGGILF